MGAGGYGETVLTDTTVAASPLSSGAVGQKKKRKSGANPGAGGPTLHNMKGVSPPTVVQKQKWIRTTRVGATAQVTFEKYLDLGRG